MDTGNTPRTKQASPTSATGDKVVFVMAGTPTTHGHRDARQVSIGHLMQRGRAYTLASPSFVPLISRDRTVAAGQNAMLSPLLATLGTRRLRDLLRAGRCAANTLHSVLKYQPATAALETRCH